VIVLDSSAAVELWLGLPRASPPIRARLALPGHLPTRSRIWELRENLTPYDAAFVSHAEALRAPLVTLDAALARAPGVRADIELYP
jgi:predicted nucleic acid-binding protein